ncbi:MAG: hypothetical protein JXA81_11345 [Sedimentisphaerales bacterium]|nr:hypothetical protein [Sedimentisphaerales bacterium]
MAKSVKSNKHRVSTPSVEDSTVSEQPAQAVKHSALSGWPMIIGWLAMLIFTVHACSHMVAAGDTWVAMACGRHFVNHGVDTVEPFSANSHKPGPTKEEIQKWPDWAQWIAGKVSLKTLKAVHPTGWINQNWLTHVIFYLLVPKSSYADGMSFSSNALVYWKFAIYIITVICVYYTGRLLGANPALCAVFSCFAMFIGRSFLDIRPAGFSNMLVAVFLLILVLTTYRNILYIWLIVPLTVFWCNVHGGYIYVFIMLVPFVGLNFLTCISKKRFISIGLKGVYHTIAAGFVAFIASIIFNPYHLTNLTHTFVISVSKHAERWRDIHEWRSAFDWSNRVGTGFPFLVLYILGIGLLILWLFSRVLMPRLLKAPRNELEAQKKLYIKLSAVFGYVAFVLACWVTFVSFSLLGLDFVSFFWCAVFVAIILLSIYKNIHYIYFVILLSLLAVWSGNAAVGYNGRYYYPFVVLPAYVILHTVASLFSKKAKYKTENIVFVILAAFVSLLLMTIIFNPFKFEEPIWKISQFLDLRRIFRPVYERNLGLSYLYLFDTLFILSMVSIIFWLALHYLKDVLGRIKVAENQERQTETYQLPRIDLAAITIAALTIYMAIRSRRFIPIAGIAACPVVAMFIDQIVRAASASRNFYVNDRLTVSPMPRKLQLFFIGAGALAVLFFGTWWGHKFKVVYLDPWPSDPKLSSVFMRMTASDAKPFYAMKFIKDNKLKGKMFNYWTEGGFIAWGQEPDPKTGKTPLQLFMDGRAQAAYNRTAFDIWTHIMSGGLAGSRGYEIMQAAQVRAQMTGMELEEILTPEDYVELGQSFSDELEKRDVWVVLMPSAVYNDPDKPASYHVLKGFELNPDWPIVFFNNRQKLYVDIRTPQGKELFEGIYNGKTIYPDDYHLNLIRAHCWIRYRPGIEEKKKALDFGIKAFDLNPMPTTIFEILTMAVNFPELSPTVDKFCSDYFDEFTEKEDVWSRQDGYRHKVEAVQMACYHLKRLAQARRDTKLVKFYADKEHEYLLELASIHQSKRW